MPLNKKNELLIFPSEISAKEIYQTATQLAKQSNHTLTEILDQLSTEHGMNHGWESSLVKLSDELSASGNLNEFGMPVMVRSLGVKLSSTYFLDSNNSLIELSEAIDTTQAKSLNLYPVVIVSLSIEGASIHGVQIIPYAEEVDISSALNSLWSSCSLLMGAPDVLKINNLMSPICKDLKRILEDYGVQIQIVDGKDRRNTANVNASQPYCISLRGKEPSLENVNTNLLSQFELIHDKKKRIWYTTLKERPKKHLTRVFAPIVIKSQFIQKPKPSALTILEISRSNNFGCVPYYVLETPKPEGLQYSIIADDWFLAVLKSLPFKPATIASVIGCSSKEFQQYLKDKAPLPDSAFWRLSQMLAFEFEHDREDEPPILSRFGPLLLTPKSKNNLVLVYNSVTRGGDQDVAYEMVSDLSCNGDYRYIIVEAYFTFYIFRMEKDWPSCQAINKDDLINFSGKVKVRTSIYKQIESLCEEVFEVPNGFQELINSFYLPWAKATQYSERIVEYWAEDGGANIKFYR